MLRLRKATEQDLDQINELATSIEFEQGIHNWTLYYRTSPRTFYVYENLQPTSNRRQNEIVGYVTRNLIFSGCILTHHIMILPEYRNQRLTKDLLKQLDVNFDGIIVANYNNKALKLVNGVKQQKPVVFGPKYTGYYGFLPSTLPANWSTVTSTMNECSDYSLCPVDASNIELILQYDQTLHPSDRSNFMKQWLLPTDDSDHTIAYCAMAAGHVVGYGAVRMMTESYYDLAPVYADSKEIAERILRTLVIELWTRKQNTVELYVSFPAEQKTTLKFCLDLGLHWHYAEMRTYENVSTQPQLPWHKVFSAHEFWLL